MVATAAAMRSTASASTMGSTSAATVRAAEAAAATGGIAASLAAMAVAAKGAGTRSGLTVRSGIAASRVGVAVEGPYVCAGAIVDIAATSISGVGRAIAVD